MVRGEEGRGGKGLGASWGEVAGGTQRVRVMPRSKRETQGIPQGTLAVSNVRAKKETNSEKRARSAGESSATTARSTRQRDVICQNIIGHRVAVGTNGFGRDGVLGGGKDRALALFDEPAGQHRGSAFFHVLIEEFADFLAEVGGVGEVRELVGLKSGARGGEKKFPGSLGAELRHVILRSDGLGECEYINNRVIHDGHYLWVHILWKSVEKQEAVGAPGITRIRTGARGTKKRKWMKGIAGRPVEERRSVAGGRVAVGPEQLWEKGGDSSKQKGVCQGVTGEEER